MAEQIGFIIPPELKGMDPSKVKSWFPDLSVKIVETEGTAQATHCRRVTFDVTFSPGLIKPKGFRYYPIKVRIFDKVKGRSWTVGEAILYMTMGDTVRGSIEWSEPPDASYTPDWHNEITVEVDPDHQALERDESNNSATVTGICVG